MASSSFSQYEARTWPLTSSTHCYTSRSSSGRWATRKHVFWIDDGQKLSSTRIPFASGAYQGEKRHRLVCVGYVAGSRWEAFSLIPETYGEKTTETKGRNASVATTVNPMSVGKSSTPPRSQSLLQKKPSTESLPSLLESSFSSLPTDSLMTTSAKDDSNLGSADCSASPDTDRPGGSGKSSSLDPNQMLLVLQRRPGENDNDDAVYRLAVSMRPAALHLVEDDEKSPRLWWGSADDCYLHRSEVMEETDPPTLTNALRLQMETSVLALDGPNQIEDGPMLLAAACQDGSVLLLWEETGTVHRKIIIDGPIVAVQLTQLGKRSVVTIGSLCGYVAQWTGDEPPALLLGCPPLQTAAGGEDPVLAVHSCFQGGEGEYSYCWVGTQSGRCFVVDRGGTIVWACQLPYPVYGFAPYNDGVLVVTQRSVHWLRSVQEAVTRAKARLELLQQKMETTHLIGVDESDARS